jgi:hypothetical protein
MASIAHPRARHSGRALGVIASKLVFDYRAFDAMLDERG